MIRPWLQLVPYIISPTTPIQNLTAKGTVTLKCSQTGQHILMAGAGADGSTVKAVFGSQAVT
jgi:hypothetical protein